MPLKIGNYGAWEGDRPGNRPGNGHHPPACTCHTCNEGRTRRAVRGRTGRAQPRPGSSPRTPSVRPRPTASAGTPQQRRSRNNYPATRPPSRRSALWFWWCLALVVTVYGFFVGLDTLDTYRTAESPQLAELPELLGQSAGAPFRWLSDFDRTASYKVTDPQGGPHPSTTPVAKPPTVDPLVEIRTTAMSLVNEARVEQGLSPLETSDELVQIATRHSEDMAARGYFAHDSPDGDTYLDRYHAAGFTCQRRIGWIIHQGAENIYKGWSSSSLTIRNWKIVTVEVANAQGLAVEAVVGWMQSPGHRANILNPIWQQQGIGVATGTGDRVYVTQNFC